MFIQFNNKTIFQYGRIWSKVLDRYTDSLLILHQLCPTGVSGTDYHIAVLFLYFESVICKFLNRTGKLIKCTIIL